MTSKIIFDYGEVSILSLALLGGDAPSLTLELATGEGAVRLFCENVSCLSLRELSFPLQIAGLEAVDRGPDGWSPEQRYCVRDYEDGQLSFYCAKICAE